MAWFNEQVDKIAKLYRAWGGGYANPNSPCGGAGAGGSSQSFPLGSGDLSFSKLPDPFSTVAKRLIPEDISKIFDNEAWYQQGGHVDSPNKINKKMTMSDDGLTLLKQIEKLRLKPYDDQTGKEVTAWVKGATIGYGYLIVNSEWNMYKNGITEADALALFKKKFAPFEAVVQDCITVSLKQNQFDALAMLAYNIGKEKGGFPDSSVVKLVNNPMAKTSYENLEVAWKSWNKSQGKVMKGLENRRQSEWNVYSQGIYKGW